MAKARNNNHGLLIVLCGPSGVGKSTISNRLKSDLGVWYTVSVTTRPHKPLDDEGKTYEHITKQEFFRRLGNTPRAKSPTWRSFPSIGGPAFPA